MKRVLITGGAGFIGSHLAELFIDEGAKVIVLDDLSTGAPDNIKSLSDNSNFTLVEGKVQDRELLDGLIAECDYVYHLAAAVGVKLIVQEPIRTIKTNIHGTESVLEAAFEHKKKVLIASTSEIYGKNELAPFCEDDDVVYGSTKYSRWAYACSKAIDEFLAIAFFQKYGLEVLITRFFNTIGKRQTGEYGMVVPRFIRAALRDEPLKIYGNGKQTRCFSYVGDITKAVKTLMESGNAFGEVYNIGSDEEVSIEELASKIITLAGSKSQTEYIDYEAAYGKPFDDMQRRVPCLEKVKKAIGYEPSLNLEAILEMIIAYERQKL